MTQYIIPIEYAFLTFPIIAFFFTMPYMFYQNYKYGSTVFLKNLIIYSFILYLINIFFLVILPLPSISEVAKLKTPKFQLEPLRFLKEFKAATVFRPHKHSTWIPALKQECFYVPFFNAVMLIPLGIYLRYYFRINPIIVVFLCFFTSCFFEFTQVTGLYGIYPRSYRVCDVDDLILNTFGGVVGLILSPIVSIFLPSREELNKLACKKSVRITFFRRLCAWFTDLFAIVLIAALVDFVYLRPVKNTTIAGLYGLEVMIVLILIYFVIVPSITKGRTLGKMVFKMKLVRRRDGNEPKPWQYFIRYSLLYLMVIGIPYILISAWQIRDKINGETKTAMLTVLCAIGGIVAIALLETFVKMMGIDGEYIYGVISGTKNVSTRKDTAS
ncbi:MAG: VanZ family protein [Lachnospiraceae bacterium]|nr:VanZ family protein [Lachnospiraceae bacterium]